MKRPLKTIQRWDNVQFNCFCDLKITKEVYTRYQLLSILDIEDKAF